MNPSAPPRDLFHPRLAARALRLALEAAEVGPLCMVFAPDDPSQVFPTPHVEGAGVGFRFADDWRGNSSQAPLATVVLLAPVPEAGKPVVAPEPPPRARVTVPCLDDLIRANHLADWDRDALGLGAGTDDDPDLDVVVDLAEVLASEGELLASAPARVEVRPRLRRLPRVILSSGRAVTRSLRGRR